MECLCRSDGGVRKDTADNTSCGNAKSPQLLFCIMVWEWLELLSSLLSSGKGRVKRKIKGRSGSTFRVVTKVASSCRRALVARWLERHRLWARGSKQYGKTSCVPLQQKVR